MSLSAETIQQALSELRVQVQNSSCQKVDGLADAIKQLESGLPDIAFVADVLAHALQDPFCKSLSPEEIPEMRRHFLALDKLTSAFRRAYVDMLRSRATQGDR